ncbi:MAG: hypothetical protein LC539_10760 [Candidatus Thiodiazotropha sp.]|nr:hypothetical protein [Candidatus Thiodiazotropha sp.]
MRRLWPLVWPMLISNPGRAGIAQTPEASEFTSITDRSTQLTEQPCNISNQPAQPCHLLSFVGNPCDEMPKGLPFRLTDYLQLVDWSGRAILDDKLGFIPDNLPPILERLQIDPITGSI